MQDYTGKVAVITGAASGIGFALAQRSAREGMHVVMADVERNALEAAAAKISATGTQALPVVTDVSRFESVEALAQRTLDTFGAVHLLCNNAGIGSAHSGPVLTATLANWQWVLGVNLWGVIHGVHAFAPVMVRQNVEAHIVNTASVAGLVSGQLGVYTVSKHAVVALTETLYEELAHLNSPVKAHVLCPGPVSTRLLEADRNRPQTIAHEPDTLDIEIPGRREWMASHAQDMRDGMSPETVADFVFDALANDRFYILTHPERKPLMQSRLEDIVQERNPSVKPYNQ